MEARLENNNPVKSLRNTNSSVCLTDSGDSGVFPNDFDPSRRSSVASIKTQLECTLLDQIANYQNSYRTLDFHMITKIID